MHLTASRSETRVYVLGFCYCFISLLVMVQLICFFCFVAYYLDNLFSYNLLMKFDKITVILKKKSQKLQVEIYKSLSYGFKIILVKCAYSN